jgi:hypothetical protein
MKVKRRFFCRKRFAVIMCAVALVLLHSMTAPAQASTAQAAPPKTSGLYLTADDYKNGRLSFAGDCSSKAHKVDLHHYFDKPYIDVTHGTEKHRYPKSDLFGYRACDGRDYRFALKVEFRILESKELYIYALDVRVSQGRGTRSVREYFFSVGADGPVLALTLKDLKQAFPDNHRFHDSLDAMFGAGQTLAEYNEVHKMFEVNRLLIASLE